MGHGGHSFLFQDMFVRLEAERRMDPGFSVSPTRSEAATSSESSPSSSAGGASNNYIEHTVSKLDTLAGIAIKYGVEVSDIKRMNGLMTDLQMFAHKTLHIPLPGRHPPSAALSNDAKTPSSVPSGRPPRYGIHSSYCNSISDIYVPEQKRSEKKTVSVAMSLLRGYYGLSPGQRKGNEGTEMSVYKTDNKSCVECEPLTPPQTYANDGSKDFNKMFKTSSAGDLFMNLGVDFTGEDTTKSTTNGIHNMGFVADAGYNEIEKTNESSVRRRSKGEGTDYSLGSTESVIKQEASSTGRGGKGLSLRPKSGGKVSLASDTTGATDHPFTVCDPHMVDAFVAGFGSLKGFGDSPGNGKAGQDLTSKVRRSSSTPSLQDPGKISPSRSRWVAKGDNQSVLTAAVAKPLFEAIPRPPNGRWNKAALD